MGRCKVPVVGLLPTRKKRGDAFAKRKESLKKKAHELSVLCGVHVALVVAPAPADAPGAAAAAAAPAPAAEVWESEPGAVLARYRALPPEARAGHTHAAYLRAELAKVEAKLARVRQGGPDALRPWDASLDAAAATPEAAARLLADIDAAIRAADDRRRALGMPPFGHDDQHRAAAAAAAGVLEGVAPLSSVAPGGAGDEEEEEDDDDDDDFLLDAPDGDDHHQFLCADDTNGYGFHTDHQGYGFQRMQCTTSTSGGAAMDGYHHLQMAPPDMYGGVGSSSFQPPNNTGMTQHDYGFQCTGSGGGGYFGMPVAYQAQQVQGAPPPSLAIWGADEPRNAMVPVAYPSLDLDTGLGYPFFASGDFTNSSLAMGTTTTTGGGGGGFINSPPALSLAMGTGGDSYLTNVAQPQPLAMSYGGGDLVNAGGYAAQWQQAPQPQHGDGDASGSQQSGIEQLHYLSDLEDTQLNLWGNN